MTPSYGWLIREQTMLCMFQTLLQRPVVGFGTSMLRLIYNLI